MSLRYITAADATAINAELTLLSQPTMVVADKIVDQKAIDDITGLSGALDTLLSGLAYAKEAVLVIDGAGNTQIVDDEADGSVGDAMLSHTTFLSTGPTPTPPSFGNPFDKIEFNLVANPAYQEGCLFYDSGEKSLAVYNSEPDVTHQVGQEFYIRVKNESGATITNGSLVYIDGDDNAEHRPTIQLAQSNSASTSNTIGMATHDIENNTFGFITEAGVVNDVVTTGFPPGAELFLSETVAGGYRVGPPPAGNESVPIGWNVRSHPSEGRILVTVSPRAISNESAGGGSAVPDFHHDGSLSSTPGDYLRFANKHTEPSDISPYQFHSSGTLNSISVSNKDVGVTGNLFVEINSIVVFTWNFDTSTGVTDVLTGANVSYSAGDLLSIRAEADGVGDDPTNIWGTIG